MIVTFTLLTATVVLDIIGQVFFKLGIGHDEGHESSTGGVVGFLRDLLSPWIVAGVLVYVAEFIVWFAALTRAPLSEAFPFNALAYVGVVLASRYVLHEKVSMRRWLGTGAIALGVALVFFP
jgi:undecaprenyl phosphate-alpha-L-ara4N flippase subunit ArnE